jgi:8-oxo-dGTP diphosphatase
LQYKAAFHPILFELLPKRFTLPQLQSLYEGIYNASLDKRNFSRKIHSAKLIIKLKEKEKENSKKGAFYYRVDKRRYNSIFYSVFNFIPNPDHLK